MCQKIISSDYLAHVLEITHNLIPLFIYFLMKSTCTSFPQFIPQSITNMDFNGECNFMPLGGSKGWFSPWIRSLFVLPLCFIFLFFKEIYNIIVSELSMLALSTTLLCKLQVSPCTFYKPGFTCFGSCVLALMDTKLLEGFPKVWSVKKVNTVTLLCG